MTLLHKKEIGKDIDPNVRALLQKIGEIYSFDLNQTGKRRNLGRSKSQAFLPK